MASDTLAKLEEEAGKWLEARGLNNNGRTRQIAAFARDKILEERKACAKTALDCPIDHLSHHKSMREKIAAAIRQRKG